MRLRSALLPALGVLSVACGGGASPRVQEPKPTGQWRGSSTGQWTGSPTGVPWGGSIVAGGLAILRSGACPLTEIAPGQWAQAACAPIVQFKNALPYRAPPFVASALPAYVDHRASGLEGPVKNQQNVGACGAFSVTTAMENALRKQGRQDVLSALHYYVKYGTVAGTGENGDAITTDAVWPYDPVKACLLSPDEGGDTCDQDFGVVRGGGRGDPRLRAEQANADSRGLVRLDRAWSIDPRDVDAIAAILAAGDDVDATFAFDRDAWSYRGIQSGVFSHYQGPKDYGHGVVLAGYRWVNGERQFLIHNSWGADWAESGYAWMAESDVRANLCSAYKIDLAEAGTPRRPEETAHYCPGGLPPIGNQCIPLPQASTACPPGTIGLPGLCLPTGGINPLGDLAPGAP
ncbi:MAG: C1 family peptidase [Polyangiaceae bacterium]